MTEPNLVDDLPKMSDTSHLDFRTPRIVCADGEVLESLLHFVRERQYRTADNVIELLV